MKTKITLLFILMLMANVGCKSKKTNEVEKAMSDEVVRYELKSRGNSRAFVISPYRFSIVTSDGQTKASGELTKEEWNQLAAALKASSPDKWATFEAPSNRRATDRVGTAQVHYTKGNTKYASVLFDHGEPPVALQDVVSIIQQISRKYN